MKEHFQPNNEASTVPDKNTPQEDPTAKALRLKAKFEGVSGGSAEAVPDLTVADVEGGVQSLTTNLAKLDDISEVAKNSPEGQRVTTTFLGKMSNRIRGFGNVLTEKIAKLGDLKTKETFAKYATGAGIAMMVGPALVQYARSHYPEVGIMFDSAPDALQQVIHFDAWAHVTNLFTSDTVETIWKGGAMDVNNLLADISSGKVDFSTLSGDQVEMLKGSIGDTVDTIKFFADKGNTETVSSLARGNSVNIAIVKGAFGNAPLFASLAVTTGLLAGKIGDMAKRKLQTVR